MGLEYQNEKEAKYSAKKIQAKKIEKMAKKSI